LRASFLSLLSAQFWLGGKWEQPGRADTHQAAQQHPEGPEPTSQKLAGFLFPGGLVKDGQTRIKPAKGSIFMPSGPFDRYDIKKIHH
jgi:hypothetical protein